MALMKFFVVNIFFLISSITSASAHADGLADLKSALVRLQSQAPIKSVIELKSINRQGEAKELEENMAQGSVVLEENQRGLQLLFDKNLLARADAESRAKEKNAQAKTPTMDALGQFNTGNLRELISAASTLSHRLEKAVFKEEKDDLYGGKPARKISFDIPIDSLTEKDRKYVKKFDSRVEIWIDSDGTPLASRFNQVMSGRAFLVITFETSNEESYVYNVVANRLITIRKEQKTSGSGAGEKGESHSTLTMQLQS